MVATLIFIYLATVCATCKKNCIRTDYSFTINTKAYPALDSIFINDTVWIELNEPTILQDALSGTSIDYSGAQNLGTAIAFDELLGNAQTGNAAMDFDLKLLQGTQVSNPNTTLIREFLFAEANGRYLFKLGIVPKRVGIFRIGLSNAANVYTTNNQCSRGGFTINFKETDQHLYFNQWNYGVTPSLPNGGYCFKVK